MYGRHINPKLPRFMKQRTTQRKIKTLRGTTPILMNGSDHPHIPANGHDSRGAYHQAQGSQPYPPGHDFPNSHPDSMVRLFTTLPQAIYAPPGGISPILYQYSPSLAYARFSFSRPRTAPCGTICKYDLSWPCCMGQYAARCRLYFRTGKPRSLPHTAFSY